MIEEFKEKWPLWATLLFLVLLSFTLKAERRGKKVLEEGIGLPDEDGVFSARIAKINERASLIRLKVDFINFKYLNRGDRVEFWSENSPQNRCMSRVVGKSNEYLLLRIPDYFSCKRHAPLGYGAYLRLFSHDLLNNLKMGKVLVGVLLKKRMALSSKARRQKDELDRYIEKVGLLSQRYQTLRDKLEAEWRGELAALENDKTELLISYNKVKKSLDDVDHKLEKYKIGDENLTMDRWSLDPKLFFRK